MKQREIKFRIWNTKGGNWYTDDHIKSNLFNYLERTQEPVMQYTGLLDKNGKEIYEGDIVKAHYTQELIGKEYYKNELITIDPREPVCGYWEDCEVIGNIYENPELLK